MIGTIEPDMWFVCYCSTIVKTAYRVIYIVSNNKLQLSVDNGAHYFDSLMVLLQDSLRPIIS